MIVRFAWCSILGFSMGLTAGCGDDDGSGGTSAGGAGAASPGGANVGGQGAGAVGGTGGNAMTGGGGSGGSFVGVDPLMGAGPTTLVDGGYQFTEGPVWLAASSELLFSDIPANTIYRLSDSGIIDVFRNPSGNANGLGAAPNGDLIACEHSNRRVTRTAGASDMATPEVVASSYEAVALNSPNDNVVRSDGTIYFTDPGYGLGGQPSALGFFGVYYVDPQGDIDLIDGNMSAPNGVALSPDESVLYVADSEDDMVVRYDVAPDGSADNKVTLPIAVTTPDGMAVDDAGNLYITSSAGVVVTQPDGTQWGTIAVPEQPSNCAFGGANRRTLYITARTGLYEVELAIPGLP